MTTKRAAASRVALMGLVLATGCQPASPNPAAKDTPTMTATHDIGYLKDGSFVPLGSVRFDRGGAGALDLTSGDPAAGRLRAAWDALASRETIHVRRSEATTDDDGAEVIEYYGLDVRRGSDEYPDALLDVLSSEHGFFSTPAPAAR